MELMIRLAEAGDGAKLIALMTQLAGESTTFSLANNLDDVSAADEGENIEALQSTANNVIMVVADEVGNLYGVVSAAAMNGRPRVAEVGVAVLAEYQGFGLGQALMAEVVNWAETFASVDGLFLTVQSQNEAAVHIYEKLGFEKIANSAAMVLNNAGELVAAFDMGLVVTPGMTVAELIG
jgi:ribosomal protein S18 acetylase RimI-like enzyme